MEILKFKKEEEERLKQEFRGIDRRLQTMLYFIVGYLYVRHGVETVITHLLRIQDEQDDIYSSHPDPAVQEAYRAKPWYSVHQCHRGADLRTRWRRKWWGSKDLTPEEMDIIAKDLDNQLDRRFEYDFGKRQTSIRHNVGRGDHIHIQVDVHPVTRMKK